jgi:O-antigen/teichoic acid export membrane protein
MQLIMLTSAWRRIYSVALPLLLSNGARVASALIINRHLAHFADDGAYAAWAVAQSAVVSVTVISDFGLSAIGPRELTRLDGEQEARRTLIGHVLGLKFITTIMAAFACFTLLLISPATRYNWEILLLAPLAVAGWGICNPWYFIVSKRSTAYYFVESSCFALYSAAVVMLIKNSSSFPMGYAFMGLIWAALGCGTVAIMLKDERTTISLPGSLTDLVHSLNSRFSSFLLVLIPAISSSAIVYLLGFRLTSIEMSRYALADRIQGAVVYGMSPVIQSMAPLFVKRAGFQSAPAGRLGLFLSAGVIGISILGVCILQQISPWIVEFMMGRPDASMNRLFGVLLWLTLPMTATSLAKNWLLIPSGLYGTINAITTTFAGVSLLFLFFIPDLDGEIYSIVRICAEVGIALAFVVAFARSKTREIPI